MDANKLKGQMFRTAGQMSQRMANRAKLGYSTKEKALLLEKVSMMANRLHPNWDCDEVLEIQCWFNDLPI
jgi:hypothetical protein